MSTIKTKRIQLTYKQRTWVLAYLLIGTPHAMDDPFCQLLMELLAQPPAKEPDLERWDGVFPTNKP